jgi:hypothetical protein
MEDDDEQRKQAAKRKLNMDPVAGGSGLAKKSKTAASQGGASATTATTATTATGTTTSVPKSHEPENPNMRRKNSLLWKYFKISETDRRWSEKKEIWHYDGICQVVTKIGEVESVCRAHIGRKDGSTSAMRYHLQSIHPGLYDELETEEQEILKKLDQGRIALQEGARKRQEYDEFRNGNVL